MDVLFPEREIKWDTCCGTRRYVWASTSYERALGIPSTLELLQAKVGVVLLEELLQLSTRLRTLVRAENSPSMSLTLAVIKPDAFSRASSIEARLRAANFAVLARATITLLPSQVAELYEDVEGTPASVLKLMTSGPVVALALEKSDAVAALGSDGARRQRRGKERGENAECLPWCFPPRAPTAMRSCKQIGAAEPARRVRHRRREERGARLRDARRRVRELRLFFPRVHPRARRLRTGCLLPTPPPLPSLPRARRLTRALVPTASRRSLRLRRRWRRSQRPSPPLIRCSLRRWPRDSSCWRRASSRSRRNRRSARRSRSPDLRLARRGRLARASCATPARLLFPAASRRPLSSTPLTRGNRTLASGSTHSQAVPCSPRFWRSPSRSTSGRRCSGPRTRRPATHVAPGSVRRVAWLALARCRRVGSGVLLRRLADEAAGGRRPRYS